MTSPDSSENKKEDSKLVYFFGEGNKDLTDLLGSKGANLNEMVNLGIPVPLGFTLTTEAYKEYIKNGELPAHVQEQVKTAMSQLEKKVNKIFGGKNPLILSVRSGSKHSMPGMLDTILNLGLNDNTVEHLAEQTNPEFAYECYKRLIHKFSEIVFDKKLTRETYDSYSKSSKEIDYMKEYVQQEYGKEFPQDVNEQLMLAIKAVFNSWNNKRAKEYRKLNKIPGDLGTAVNIQLMVFGNKGEKSATGVIFTRSPVDGKNEVYGEYLVNSQGEELVAGQKTPKPIKGFKEENPQLYQQLEDIAKKLEKHYKTVQDIEFTVEDEKLWILQTRKAELSSHAELKTLTDMAEEGLLTKEEAINRTNINKIIIKAQETLDPSTRYKILAKGIGASQGIVSGEIALTSKKAEQLAKQGKKVILVREETSPEDIKGIKAATGILTQKGGSTSHAALITRAMNKCCITGCEGINIRHDYISVDDEEYFTKEYYEGEKITLNGYTGEVIAGEVKTVKKEKNEDLEKIIKWSENLINKKIETNADTPKEIQESIKKGATSIGLCRTEHLFLIKDSLDLTLEYKVKTSDKESLLKKMGAKQKDYYKKILEATKDNSIRIMLLNRSLNHFRSKKDYTKEKNNANNYSGDIEKLYIMQVKALTQAYSETDYNPKVEIIIPEIVPKNERQDLKTKLEETSNNENITINPEPEKTYFIENPKHANYEKIGKAETIITKPKNLDITKIILAKYAIREQK
ncbi:MAG: pyruvate, phosphate dikinase [Nanoarchaeota archaeon]|nr:pyruvate, phosphate dikinase [Nanoarchaeota archaeon]